MNTQPNHSILKGHLKELTFNHVLNVFEDLAIGAAANNIAVTFESKDLLIVLTLAIIPLGINLQIYSKFCKCFHRNAIFFCNLCTSRNPHNVQR